MAKKEMQDLRERMEKKVIIHNCNMLNMYSSTGIKGDIGQKGNLGDQGLKGNYIPIIPISTVCICTVTKQRIILTLTIITYML